MQKDLIQKGIFENILYVKQVYKHSASYNLAFPSPDKTFLRQPIYSFNSAFPSSKRAGQEVQCNPHYHLLYLFIYYISLPGLLDLFLSSNVSAVSPFPLT